MIQIYFAQENILKHFQTANIELEKIAIWFQANKLFLNESKKSLLFFINPGIKIIYI